MIETESNEQNLKVGEDIRREDHMRGYDRNEDKIIEEKIGRENRRQYKIKEEKR